MKTFFKPMTIILLLGMGLSCEDILEVPDISNETVQLVAPAENSIVVQTDVSFSWTEVYEAKSYHVQVATPNFENASQIVMDSIVVVDSTFTSPRITKILTNNDYEWRIKAINSAYETSFFANRFVVDTLRN
ncbi:hypothetical protein [Maribacter sp. 2210JD10-5]|uniref:hypothetical protein n=1 Tax=Maribacter sp. 2210JD10-5 TaxID=3386272 RepID=UPI0039BCD238